MALASARVRDRLTFLSADSLSENYFARVPLAHALFRAAELWMLEEAILERPVLDLGCGRGEFAGLGLIGIIDEGVDVAASELDFARRTGCYRQLRQGDAHCLPYPDGAFRSVISISVLEHVRQPYRAVQEIYRVLAPGGLFVATVVLRDLHRHLALANAFGWCGLAALADAYLWGHDRVFRHVSLFWQREWDDLLSEAGFGPVRTSRVVSRRVVFWWEALMWLAWPYRVWRSAGNLLARKPRRFGRWLHRRFRPLLREQDDHGACLFIVAEKPDRAARTDEREEECWEREQLVDEENLVLCQDKQPVQEGGRQQGASVTQLRHGFPVELDLAGTVRTRSGLLWDHGHECRH